MVFCARSKLCLLAIIIRGKFQRLYSIYDQNTRSPTLESNANGLKNASAAFQREIDAALGSLRLTCCIAYIDDVCIYSNGSLADHMIKGQSSTKSSSPTWLHRQPNEVCVRPKSIQFLGFVVSENGVYAQEEK